MEMSADEIDKLFESYEFRDPLDYKLTRNVVFQELFKTETNLSVRYLVRERRGRPFWPFAAAAATIESK
jgi:hypothetical protein